MTREEAVNFLAREADYCGPLHIVIDDQNVDDSNIAYVQMAPLSEKERSLCDFLLSLDEEDRYDILEAAEDRMRNPR